jgi:hypothetical protein
MCPLLTRPLQDSNKYDLTKKFHKFNEQTKKIVIYYPTFCNTQGRSLGD